MAEAADMPSIEIKKPPFFGSCRFTLMVLCNFGIFQMMLLRFNLSMAIVCMTKPDDDEDITFGNIRSENSNQTLSHVNSSDTVQVRQLILSDF